MEPTAMGGLVTTPKALWALGREQVLNLFLAGDCSLCQRPAEGGLCVACQRQLRQCQLPNPLDRQTAGLPLVSWGRYEGSLRQVIGQLKYGGQTAVAAWLGTELGHTWRQCQATVGVRGDRPIALVPIPLHPSRRAQRGFNQAELLARWMNRVAQTGVAPEGLLRVKMTQAQHHLNRQDRQENLAQAFQVNAGQLDRLRQRTVWLVDDIFTTGATAQAAAYTLRRSGISVGGICTLARALAWDVESTNGLATTPE